MTNAVPDPRRHNGLSSKLALNHYSDSIRDQIETRFAEETERILCEIQLTGEHLKATNRDEELKRQELSALAQELSAVAQRKEQLSQELANLGNALAATESEYRRQKEQLQSEEDQRRATEIARTAFCNVCHPQQPAMDAVTTVTPTSPHCEATRRGSPTAPSAPATTRPEETTDNSIINRRDDDTADFRQDGDTDAEEVRQAEEAPGVASGSGSPRADGHPPVSLLAEGTTAQKARSVTLEDCTEQQQGELEQGQTTEDDDDEHDGSDCCFSTADEFYQAQSARVRPAPRRHWRNPELSRPRAAKQEDDEGGTVCSVRSRRTSVSSADDGGGEDDAQDGEYEPSAPASRKRHRVHATDQLRAQSSGGNPRQAGEARWEDERRTIEYADLHGRSDTIYQDRNTKAWYILRCDAHNTSFSGDAPLKRAICHLRGEQIHPEIKWYQGSIDSNAARRHLGIRVLNCNADLAKRHNEAAAGRCTQKAAQARRGRNTTGRGQRASLKEPTEHRAVDNESRVNGGMPPPWKRPRRSHAGFATRSDSQDLDSIYDVPSTPAREPGRRAEEDGGRAESGKETPASVSSRSAHEASQPTSRQSGGLRRAGEASAGPPDDISETTWTVADEAADWMKEASVLRN